MSIYRDVSDWKGKANRLLDALRDIAQDNGCLTPAGFREIAKQAIRKFERS